MTPDEETDEVRRSIRAAMNRLLADAPLVVDPGKHSILDLAREADVKRHYLTHKHKDLADEFKGLIATKTREKTDPAVAELEEKIAALREELAETEAERTRWENHARDYKRIIQVLYKQREMLSQEVERMKRGQDRRSTLALLRGQDHDD